MIRPALLTLLGLLAVACAAPHALLPEDRANLVLFVSNQGPAIPVVDIAVWIDGRLATRGDYEVGDQHEFETVCLRLAPGTHTIRARSKRGGATLERDFELPAKRWAGLNFWAPTPAAGETPQTRFSFHVSEEPVYFE